MVAALIASDPGTPETALGDPDKRIEEGNDAGENYLRSKIGVFVIVVEAAA